MTKGNYTSLVILVKCAPYNSAYAGKSVYLPSSTTGSNPGSGVSFNSHLIRFRITQLLANAKNQTLYASDLLRALVGGDMTLAPKLGWKGFCLPF